MVNTGKGREEPARSGQSSTKKRRVAGPSEDSATTEADKGHEHLSEPEPDSEPRASASTQSQAPSLLVEEEAASSSRVPVDTSEDRAEIEVAIQRRLDTLRNEQQDLLRTMYRARVDQEILVTARNTIDLRIRELQNRRAAALSQTSDEHNNERG